VWPYLGKDGETIKLYNKEISMSSNTGIGSMGRYEIRNWRTL
jgi:hypothetical protein